MHETGCVFEDPYKEKSGQSLEEFEANKEK